MEWSTHFLSGVVAGYAVSGGDWRGAVVGGIAGVVPDLDEHKSRFGKVFFPISFIINKIFGHRTLTHSLLFAVGIGFILSMFFDSYIWQSATFGILAHIAGDMLTGKVQLLYPSKMAIGIGVGPMSFKIIDRVTALTLLIIVIMIGSQYVEFGDY